MQRSKQIRGSILLQKSGAGIRRLAIVEGTLYEVSLSGLSQKFLDITIVQVEFASSIGLGEGPVDRFVIEIPRVSPHQHCLTYSKMTPQTHDAL